jgi:hypothetical protein
VKVFEIYDRIAMGGIGHQGIRRLMAAIEVASTEGSPVVHDVSSPASQLPARPGSKGRLRADYAPYLARMLFVELGEAPPQPFLRCDATGHSYQRRRFGTGL